MLKNYLSKFFAFAVFFMAANFLQAQFAKVTIDPPSGAAGTYYGKVAVWSGAVTTVSGDIVQTDDATGTTGDGCEAIVNDVNGKIALIDRGTCGFAVKAVNAQNAGAAAIVICNNAVANPYTSITMRGTPTAPITIPALMLSYNDCQVIKAALAGGVAATISEGAPVPGPGEDCTTATVIPGAGTYATPDMVAGLGGVYAGHGAWFSYTPAATTLAKVSSCGGGVNTRLWVVTDGCDVQTLVTSSDDNCDNGTGAINAAEASWLAIAGVEYLIQWDDASSYLGFNWTLSESPPTIAVTFNVDMQFETTDPGGVYIAGTFNGWTPQLMTDNGNNTWSYTTDIQIGSEVQWKYLNGTGGWESGDLSACGVDNGVGSYNRREVFNVLTAVNLDLVCFNQCGGCVPTDCDNPIALINDNFDSYTAGTNNLGPQALHWSTWANAEGTPEDGSVSTAFAKSAPNSMEIKGTNAAGGAQDVLLLLRDKTAGNYILSWNMYIPAGKGGYFNIQKFEGNPGGEYAYQCYFDANGTGFIAAGADGAANFTYPQDQWVPVVHYIDLDNDWIDLYVNNQHIYGWPFKWTSFIQEDKAIQLGSIDFFPRDLNDNYFVDDVYYAAIPPAAEGNYCYTAIPVEAGVHTAPELTCFGGPVQSNVNARKAAWYAYTATQDGFISVGSCDGGADTRVWIYSGDCSQRTLIGMNDDECLSTGTDLYASYREAPVKAGETYYIVWDGRWEQIGFDWELSFFTDVNPGDFCSTAIPVTYGQHTIDYFAWAAVTGNLIGTNSGSFPTPYANSKWYSFTPETSGNVKLYTCGVASTDTRVWVYTGDCSSLSSLTLAATNDDACDPQTELLWVAEAGTTYFIEWDDLADDSAPHDWVLEKGAAVVDITFRVDASKINVSAQGVKIRGSWNGYANESMTNQGGGIWTYTRSFEAGTEITYRFSNGNANVEPGGALWACGTTVEGTAYRKHVAGEVDETLPAVCFGSCLPCGEGVAVNFQVDLTYYLLTNPLATVKIAGNFADKGAIGMQNWTPPASPAFADLGNDVWGTTIEFPAASAGQELLFKFLNTADSWGTCSIQQECLPSEAGDCRAPGGDGNRLAVLPATNTTLCYTWDACIGCNVVDTKEQFVEIPMTVAPNPFSNRAVVTFHNGIVEGQLKLSSLTGQLVRTYKVNGTQVIIEKNDLAPGIYFLNVVTGQGTSVAEKLIVE